MFTKSFGRLLAGTAALAAIVLFSLVIFVTPASAGGGCESAMASGTTLFEIQFTGGTTENLPGPVVMAGNVICIEADGVFDVGFKSASEFLLNGSHIKMSTDATSYYDGANIDAFATFLITGGDVETTFSWAPTDAAAIVAYVGQLRPATRPTPPPAASTPTPPPAWYVVPLPASFGVGDKAYWDLKPISGTLSLEVSARVAYTLSTPSGVLTPTLSLLGSYDVRLDVVEGLYSAPILTRGVGFWQARLTGTSGAVLRMKGTTTVPPATGLISIYKSASGKYHTDASCKGAAVVFDPARHSLVGSCGGGSGAIWSPSRQIGASLPPSWRLNR